jgi:hypothetical protein
MKSRKALIVGAVVTATLSLTASEAQAINWYQATWDLDRIGEVYGSTPSIDCATGEVRCSLKLDPAGPAFTGIRAPVPTALGHTVVRFAFKNEADSQDVDAEVNVELSNGGYVVLHLTDWGGGNHGLSLFVPGGEVRRFDLTTDTWSGYFIDIDWFAGIVTAGREGSTAYAQLSLARTYDRLAAVDLRAVRWGSGSAVHFDSLAVVAGI